MNKDTRLSGVLHILLHLGQTTAPQTSETLAKAMGTNAAVFRRTMAGLRDAGYVLSEKGHGGAGPWLRLSPTLPFWKSISLWGDLACSP